MAETAVLLGESTARHAAAAALLRAVVMIRPANLTDETATGIAIGTTIAETGIVTVSANVLAALMTATAT